MPDIIRFFEVKEVGEDGTFTGIASIYGVEDLGGDIIDKGAFKKTISENSSIPILWQHETDEVIGSGTVKEWQGKILLEGQLDMEDPIAVKAYGKLKKKLIKGLSIGFNTIKSTWEEVEGRLVRHITELKLWEVSIVTFPMLPSAQVTRVKSAQDEEQSERRLKALENEILALRSEITSIKEADNPKPPVTSDEPDFHSLLTDSLRKHGVAV